MVKGISRRVVVVQPDQNGLFEQAIFLVRDYTAPRGDLVREACRIADEYLDSQRKRPCRRFTKLQLAAAFGLGVLLSSIVWALAFVWL